MTNAGALSDDADLTSILLDGTVAILRPRPVLRTLPPSAVLAGNLSRHGGDCRYSLCPPCKTEAHARLAKAEADDDIAMIHRCRQALTGDRQAVSAYRAAVELEQLMGGAL